MCKKQRNNDYRFNIAYLLGLFLLTISYVSASANTYFVDSGQSLGNSYSYAVALGDCDGDGDLDAFVANENFQPNKVWLNDGAGNFSDSGQLLGGFNSRDVALGDLDDDNDLDAFVVNANDTKPNRVWLNDGTCSFYDSGQTLGSKDSYSVALGDLDNDNDLDAFIANRANDPGNTVWLNDGAGNFSDSGQSLGNLHALDVALGDLDNDNDLDAFVVNSGSSNQFEEIWLNNGDGTFVDSGHSPGGLDSSGISLGDLDNDSDLDAFIANFGTSTSIGAPNSIWFNNGYGVFIDSGQELGAESNFARQISTGVAVGDLDNDNDLDAFVISAPTCTVGGAQVWLNDGAGNFSDSGLSLNPCDPSQDVELGDLDGDGDLDAFVANEAGYPNRVYLNEAESNSPPTLTVNYESLVGNEGDTIINFGALNDPEGDEISLSASIGTVIGNDNGTWTWSFDSNDGAAESQLVSIIADDGQDTSEVSFMLTVNNVVPMVSPIMVPLDPVLINTEISASAVFTDPGKLDTHTAVWDWGDGTTSTGTITEADGSGSVETIHTYTAAGVYTIQLTVTDKDGGSRESVYEFVVVYNPGDGFVTGAGWFESEPGWCQLNDICASASGKARFGFVSKYQKGAATPTGNTDFNFKSGDLNFHSGEYHWLVVTGGNYAKYKGTGTINGTIAPNGELYKFQIWAGDETGSGGEDTFRIKIWYEENGTEIVVYDNGSDQAIGGGNIQVHDNKK